MLTLDQASSGSYIVIAMNGESLNVLKAMGLIVGREFDVIRAGSPLIIGVLGARVGVSHRLAKDIEIDSLIQGKSERVLGTHLPDKEARSRGCHG